MNIADLSAIGYLLFSSVEPQPADGAVLHEG
jgi:hypothetical protein